MAKYPPLVVHPRLGNECRNAQAFVIAAARIRGLVIEKYAAYPHPVRVVPSVAIDSLRGPGYVLTVSPADSARLRTAFPRAAYRLVGRYKGLLWTLPATP